MRNRIMLGVPLAAVLLACSALPAEETLKSGPQVGSTKIPAFNPLNVTGPDADQRRCQV
jgi:hypothetical protein